ncbi:MAG TPA: hypothetical protein VK816_04785 [Jatrophihabitantaceae bacterium]|nr:hypothetical protein [Jatrophihabitantaceae bacterium]
MNTYTVHAKRWDHGWELNIDGLGVTQTRTLARAERDARDYIELLTGNAGVDIVLVPSIGPLDQKIVGLKRKQAQVAELQEKVAAESRALVAELQGMGLTGDDIARTVGISAQRVSQLAARKASGTGTGR